jgi:hypothetical protein
MKPGTSSGTSVCTDMKICTRQNETLAHTIITLAPLCTALCDALLQLSTHRGVFEYSCYAKHLVALVIALMQSQSRAPGALPVNCTIAATQVSWTITEDNGSETTSTIASCEGCIVQKTSEYCKHIAINTCQSNQMSGALHQEHKQSTTQLIVCRRKQLPWNRCCSVEVRKRQPKLGCCEAGAASPRSARSALKA